MGEIAVADLLRFESCDAEPDESMVDVLAMKRLDPHYKRLLNELNRNGFRKPIHLHPDQDEVTDGHHRIVAAIDLGFTHVPFAYRRGCAADSGEWGEEEVDDEWAA